MLNFITNFSRNFKICKFIQGGAGHSPAGELEMQKNLSIVFKGAMRMP